ncbi:MAG: hypothetical protein AVO33_06010 [delta proteobacterium ML8_F1]|nr:MAG: hypothetical protein AVO33_06010 [delta proteobacterium ML8_F1]
MTDNYEKETAEIDLRELLDVLRRRLVLIVIVTLLSSGIAALVSIYYIAPVYQTKTTLLVKQEASENALISQLQLSDVNLNMRLAQTYSEIITSRRVLGRVVENLELEMAPEVLKNSITVNQVKDTELIDISVKSGDPYGAMVIANEIAEVFIEEVEKIMKIETVNVLDEAVVSRIPISPNKTLNTLKAGILGLMASIFFFLLIETLDRTLKTASEVKNHLGLNVVGAIPFSEDLEDREISSEADPRSAVSEAYRVLRTNLRFAAINREVKTLLITSSIEAEGKSTTSINLASSLGQTGVRVLLVDADFRKPVIYKSINRKTNIGLTNILTEEGDYRDYIIRESGKCFDTLSSGTIPPNPSEILGSPAMKAFIEQVRTEYDYVIFDTPPVAVVTDAAVLSTLVDASLLVVSAGKVDYHIARRAVELLRNVNANLVGAILSMIPIRQKGYYYNMYATYYGEYDKKQRKRRFFSKYRRKRHD